MIRLSLPLPPSQNQLIRAGINAKSGRVYKPGAKLRDDYREWVRLAAIAAGVAGKGMTGAICVRVMWYYGKRRILDIDNGAKVLLDSLAAAIGFNDRQIVGLTLWRCSEGSEKPRAEVELRELEYEEGRE